MMPRRTEPPTRPSQIIFRPWKINPKTGEKMWAKHYGLKAWPIPISDDREPTAPEKH